MLYFFEIECRECGSISDIGQTTKDIFDMCIGKVYGNFSVLDVEVKEWTGIDLKDLKEDFRVKKVNNTCKFCGEYYDVFH